MNTAIINIKTNPKVKAEFQKIADELGLSVSALINGYLKEIVRSKKVTFSLSEKPSRYLVNAIKQAEKDLKQGKASPAFKTGKEAVKWLEEQGV